MVNQSLKIAHCDLATTFFKMIYESDLSGILYAHCESVPFFSKLLCIRPKWNFVRSL